MQHCVFTIMRVTSGFLTEITFNLTDDSQSYRRQASTIGPVKMKERANQSKNDEMCRFTFLVLKKDLRLHLFSTS